MNAIGGQTVTIDREHFETILRRANFVSPYCPRILEASYDLCPNLSPPFKNPDDFAFPVVSISQSEFDGLRQIASKYANLRQNLLRGGVGEETIDLLSQDDATIEQRAPLAPVEAETTLHHERQEGRPHQSHGAPRDFRSHNLRAKTYAQVDFQEVSDWADVDVPEEDGSASGGVPGGYYRSQLPNEQAPTRPFYQRQCPRTLLLSNLAEGVTHSDITEVVRGGQLLDIYLRPMDRSATVSFLQAVDARAFFDHVRRHDLYIKQKRVDVRWNDRQFILPGHVASKIGLGATRNLVVRRCDPRLTEETIREDLDHIHNLVVIKVEIKGGSCYIRTNSVHNAMFARTCMMSRAKYKGSKIDWDIDECCQPLGQPSQIKPRKEHVPTKKSNGSSMANRFHLLDLDDDDDDGEGEVSPAFGSKKTIGIAA